MVTTRIERVSAADGDSFDAHVTVPDTGSGPGLVLCQEIFGVGDYILGSAARLAALGFVVMAPDLFWRIERNVALPHDEEGLGKALELLQRLDFEKAVEDTGATLQHLRELS
jgi:carboxymethylenebutenolidase